MGSQTQTEERKPSRGRPRLLSEKTEKSFRNGGHGLQYATRRTIYNQWFAAAASKHLFKDGGYEFVPLEPEFAHFLGKGGGFKFTIMSELGRILWGPVSIYEPDPDSVKAMLEVARVVGAMELPTKQAIAMIRRARFGAEPPATNRLTANVVATVQEHLIRYPETSLNEVLEALNETERRARAVLPTG